MMYLAFVCTQSLPSILTIVQIHLVFKILKRIVNLNLCLI